jgi:hypothetical protein
MEKMRENIFMFEKFMLFILGIIVLFLVIDNVLSEIKEYNYYYKIDFEAEEK